MTGGPGARRIHGRNPASKSRGAIAAAAGGLETERLRLEPLVEAHAALLFEGLKDPRLYRFMQGVEPPSLPELELRFRDRAVGLHEPHTTRLQWAAWARDERRHVGLFEAAVSEGGRASLAYLIFVSAWRRGHALEACRRILRHLFDDHAVSVVRVITAVENVPSRALAERLGFRAASAPCLLPEEEPADGYLGYLLERPARGDLLE